jgi:hypothetical protein
MWPPSEVFAPAHPTIVAIVIHIVGARGATQDVDRIALLDLLDTEGTYSGSGQHVGNATLACLPMPPLQR